MCIFCEIIRATLAQVQYTKVLALSNGEQLSWSKLKIGFVLNVNFKFFASEGYHVQTKNSVV